MDSTTCGDRSRFRALSPRNDCTVCIAFTRRGDKIGTTEQQKTPAFLGRSQADCPGDPTLADRYDQKKYWPKVYTYVRREFSQPAEHVSNEALVAATSPVPGHGPLIVGEMQLP